MPRKEVVKKLIEDELARNTTKPGWQGKGIIIDLSQFSLTADLREQVQEQGKDFGCHTCITHLETDKDQPWVGDHIPPTELAWGDKKSVMGKDWDESTYLFPQCHECSHKQSAVVRNLKNKTRKYADLTAGEKKLIGFGRLRLKGKYIDSSGPKVTATEGDQIQQLGVRNGCHSCGTKYPVLTYHADHSFPQEFCTHYMEEVFKDLGLAYPTSFDLRPQCPRCSGQQGGKMKQIMDVATAYATENLKIVVYKF